MDLLIKEIKELEYAENITKGYKLPVQIDDGTILQCNVEDIVNLSLSDVNDTIVQTISYDDLAELKSGSGLKSGKFYKIEYTTKHIIPNTQEINEGTLENLIILAQSENTFHNRVISIEYPKDEIDYDFDNNLCEDGITARRGWITRRKDTIYNNEVVGFDFKNAKFRRYQVEWDSIIDEWNLLTSYDKDDVIKYTDDYIYVCLNDATEAGTLPTDNTKFIKLFAVTDYVCLTTNSDLTVYIGNNALSFKGNGFLFQDNYLFDYTNVSNINNYVKCTVANNNTISGNFYNNTISGEFSNNTISVYFSNNTIWGGDFSNNTILGNFYNNTILGYFYNNTILGEFSNNTISGYFSNNTISGNFYNNTILGYFYNNTILGEFSNNTISVYFSNNTIWGGDFSNNTISGNFYNNTILGYFYNNTISVYFSNNTISRDFNNNTILGYFYNNTISGNFRYNQILTKVQNVDFSLATKVYTSYNKTIALNSLDILYLSYVDGDNVQQIVNITD